jgi:uncharacterized membrane protein YkvA (DUF1232 family)
MTSRPRAHPTGTRTARHQHMAQDRERPRSLRFRDQDDEDDRGRLPERRSIQPPRLRRKGGREPERPARGAGAKEMVRRVIRDIPAFLKLFGRLAMDGRVSAADKAIVVATVTYVLLPLDFLPDVIPFMGQVDDVYLMLLALTRLLNNAGMDVLLDHWDGEVETLEAALGALDKASGLLPDRVRGLLGRRV